MRAPVSVILAVRGAGGALPRQLSSLGEGLREGLIRELIVVDCGASDAVMALAEAAGAMVLRGPPERDEALRRGAEAASGEWLLFGRAGSTPVAGWSGQVLRCLAQRPSRIGRIAARPGGFAAGWRFWPGPSWTLVPQALYQSGESTTRGARYLR